MDREVVEEKLESLRRCIHRVSEKCPRDVETLKHDLDLQDILALNLSRAVQMCVDIGAHLLAGLEVAPPDTMGQTFDLLDGWRTSSTSPVPLLLHDRPTVRRARSERTLP